MLVDTLSLAVKLGSILTHVEELLSPDGHAYDRTTIEALLSDPEVEEFMNDLRKAVLLPVKRN